MSNIYIVYDAGSTMVRGCFSSLELAQQFVRRGTKNGDFDGSALVDLYVYETKLDEPINVGLDNNGCVWWGGEQ